MANQSSLNENLIGAGLNPSAPQSTYVDFAEQVAKNQAEQANQEQALALAKQHVAQAKIQTANQTEAQAAGFNPVLADMMTKEDAVSTVQVLLKAKGIKDTDEEVDQWAQTLPPLVNRQVVEAFASRLMGERIKFGQSFVATDDDAKSTKKDENGDALVSGESYTAVTDNQGDILHYIRAGKLPADTSAKTAQHGADQDRKDWKALGTQLTKAFTTRSGGLGSISTSIFRATRAINTIDNYKHNLTAQDLENIAQDIGAIFQGGAPTVESAKGNNYQTLFTNFQNTFRKYTGILVPTNEKAVKDTTDKMLEVLNDLRDSAIANIDRYAEFQAPIFQEITTGNPDRWEEVKKKYIELASSGLLIPPGENTHLNITGMDIATPQKDTKSKPDKKSDGKSSGMKLPAMDDIDAELAKRNKSEKK